MAVMPTATSWCAVGRTLHSMGSKQARCSLGLQAASCKADLQARCSLVMQAASCKADLLARADKGQGPHSHIPCRHLPCSQEIGGAPCV